jgi:eukaryotic-like serine/threonine-protein kinase
MTPALWERLKPLYHAALEMPEEERANFISNACAGDDQVRKELAALLEATGETTVFNDSPILNHKDLFPKETGKFPIGALILDRFRILRHLGSGGMGDVYEAIDLELGRVALKTIRSDISNSPDMLSRFRKEVQLARKISGPHVCRIHELFVLTGDKNGSHGAFLTMEFLEGVTLAERLRKSGPLMWCEAQTVAIEICDGLQTIHQADIIHRDLKSQNIMLASRNGSACAVLMDFGLARELSARTFSTQSDLTKPGVIVGTPNYMAPEQFEGKELTPATDVYALGIVLYELVTGKHPFAASSPIEAAVLRGRRPCLASSIRSDLPHRVDEIICKCLEFDADRRYRSANEVAEDLRSHLFSIVWLRRSWLRLLSGSAALVLLISSLLLIPAVRERLRGMLFSSREKHIAVLPLDSAGESPETQALGDGLMDSLAGKLANLGTTNQSLWVIPASEVRSRKVTNPSSALREFGATIVVKGSFERNDQAARLKLTLIDSRNTREIGYVEVESATGDLAELQDRAVTRLGRLMNISVSEVLPEMAVATTRPAYEEYLTAVGYIERFDKPGNLDRAIRALENAVKTDPQFALGFARLAQVYDLKYRMDRNFDWLRQAEAYGTRAAELDDRVPLTYIVLGGILEDTGNHDLAIHQFQRALTLDSRNAEAWSGIASSYAKGGRISEAEAAYVKSASLRPDDWSGPYALGNFYDSVGRHKEAIMQYRRAVELSPDNSALFENFGIALLNSGDVRMLAEAEESLKRSIEINPTYEAYSSLGVLYEVQRRYHEGLIACEKATKMNGNSYDAWNNLALAYESVGDTENADAARKKAVELLEKTLLHNSKDAEARAMLAALMAKNGMRSNAIEDIRISLSQSPPSLNVLLEVADAYALLGDRRNAIKFAKSALKNGAPADLMGADPDIRSILPDAISQVSAK